MTVRDELVAWMKQELPHVKDSSEEILSAITKGKQEQGLSEKVTRRVRTEAHAKENRAFLNFTAEDVRFEPSNYNQQQLQGVLEQTKRVEEKISLLREQLREVDDSEERDRTAGEIDEAAMNGGLRIVTDPEKT